MTIVIPGVELSSPLAQGTHTWKNHKKNKKGAFWGLRKIMFEV